jgi:hypothetical protein
LHAWAFWQIHVVPLITLESHAPFNATSQSTCMMVFSSDVSSCLNIAMSDLLFFGNGFGEKVRHERKML